MSPGRLGILTDALTAIARLIMEARSDRDAEAIVHQLRALGPAQRADVDAVEADARRRLRRAGLRGFVQECHRMPCVCDVRPLIGGPLGEGD